MDTPGPLKKVPKWAWIASVGVVGGVAVMRWRSNKGSQVDTAAAGDYTSPADYSQAVSGFPATGTIDSGYTGDTSNNGSPVDIPGLIESIGGVFATAQQQQPVQPTLPEIITAISQLPGYAGSGGAPSSNTTQNPIDNNTPPPPPAPTPAPVAPVAPVKPPAAVSSGPQCGGEFPLVGPHGCYKVVCASGKGDHAKGRWHYYQSGLQEHVNSSC